MAEQRIDLAAVRALLDRLPEGLEASDRETWHLELSTPADMFWLDLLDAAAAYRRDVPALLAEIDWLKAKLEECRDDLHDEREGVASNE